MLGKAIGITIGAVVCRVEAFATMGADLACR